MAKANSPVRLENDLMTQAKLAGSLSNRSAIEQIEYWASLGRNVSKLLDPETLIRINSGLAKLRVECTESAPLDADEVFASVDAQRDSGELSEIVTTSTYTFRASKTQEGLLEKVDSAGNVTIGRFSNGKFVSI